MVRFNFLIQQMNQEKKILVIDDNTSNLLLIKSILSKSHPEFTIILVNSGIEGIEIAHQEMPETILLDIFMPDMDGYETCRQLKSNEKTEHIPVLMISAGGQNSDIRLEGLNAGADAITSKPFERQEFIALVNVMLRIKKTEDKLKKQNQELQNNLLKINDYQLRLKKMNADLLISEEKERRRIAEFLHDGISQILSLAYIKLTALINSDQLPKTEKGIRESVDLINNAISETRSLTYDLSPPILYELGLTSAVKWKLEQIEEKYGIVTSLKSNIEKLEINTDIRILLFRIISELITNVIKHADADLIKIELTSEQNNLYIAVNDNGKGFDFSKKAIISEQGGFGLFSIRERLESINGSIHFESGNNSGTKAMVQIPI